MCWVSRAYVSLKLDGLEQFAIVKRRVEKPRYRLASEPGATLDLATKPRDHLDAFRADMEGSWPRGWVIALEMAAFPGGRWTWAQVRELDVYAGA